MGVLLRRVTPPRRPLPVKQPDPIQTVVLRKVEKPSTAKLRLPRVPIAKGSPPPPITKAMRNRAAQANTLPKASATPTSKHIHTNIPSTSNAPSSPAAKSAAASPANQPAAAATPAPAKPPVNLLLNRPPPTEIVRIEGDRIIIIKRIPRKKPPSAAEVAAAEAAAAAAARAAAEAAEKRRAREERVHARALEIIAERRAAREAAALAAGVKLPAATQKHCLLAGQQHGHQAHRRTRTGAVVASARKTLNREPLNREPFCLIRQKVKRVCGSVFVCMRPSSVARRPFAKGWLIETVIK